MMLTRCLLKLMYEEEKVQGLSYFVLIVGIVIFKVLVEANWCSQHTYNIHFRSNVPLKCFVFA